MQNPKSLSELLAKGGNRLAQLQSRSMARAQVLDTVRGALTAKLAAAVVSAGLEQGKLTIGVVGAVWASRLRYATAALKSHVTAATGNVVQTVRVRVVAPHHP